MEELDKPANQPASRSVSQPEETNKKQNNTLHTNSAGQLSTIIDTHIQVSNTSHSALFVRWPSAVKQPVPPMNSRHNSFHFQQQMQLSIASGSRAPTKGKEKKKVAGGGRLQRKGKQRKRSEPSVCCILIFVQSFF